MTATGTAGNTTATACTRPGCTGTIEDGYCDVCGMAAQPAGAAVGTASGGQGSAPVSGPGSGSGGTGSTGSRRTRSGSTRSSRGHLGAGLIDITPVPARDPVSAVLTDPQVPESKRFCGTCERPVGRGRGGKPGLTEGFCPNCGAQFSFAPKLERGEMVAGQYEVLGCLAHGGLGWIYLATDHNLGNRWVVLKGLLNTGDAAAMEAAVAERRFLAEVEHPNIVGVYNFVQHPDRRTGEPSGYIVMEYVGGQSLRQILLERRKVGESLAVPVALAYAIELLPALGYLHSRGLVYCDFKPDNVIQTEEQLKLIDMGGVRRIDDDDSPIYGTIGYQAPEIAAQGPSPSSDLYTVGRALAVLTFEFTGYQTQFEHSLPDPASVPVLAQHDSFLRVLRRATNTDPEQRFASAGEMAEQLTGVLREVLSASDSKPRPAFSSLFSAEVQTIGVPGAELAIAGATTPPGGQHAQVGAQPAVAGAQPALTGAQPALAGVQPGPPGARPAPPPAAAVVAGLPVPVVDNTDAAAGFLATLSTMDPAQRRSALAAAVAGEQGTPPAVAESAETRFALARALIVAGHPADAAPLLADAHAADPGDWRVQWYQGLHDLAAGHPDGARAAFDAVVDALPGEPAPKLALGLAAEAAGDLATAARFLQVVWTVDRSYVSAAFGLGRIRLAAGDRAGAIAALGAVPDTSSQHLAAQVAAVRIRLSPAIGVAWAPEDELQEAGRQLSMLQLDDMLRQRLTSELLQAALTRVLAGQRLRAGKLAGCDPNERGLRFGLEGSYRAQARLVPDVRRRIELVDLANQVRPRTLS
jgi:serine/threonine-protein kinase PknG